MFRRVKVEQSVSQGETVEWPLARRHLTNDLYIYFNDIRFESDFQIREAMCLPVSLTKLPLCNPEA